MWLFWQLQAIVFLQNAHILTSPPWHPVSSYDLFISPTLRMPTSSYGARYICPDNGQSTVYKIQRACICNLHFAHLIPTHVLSFSRPPACACACTLDAFADIILLRRPRAAFLSTDNSGRNSKIWVVGDAAEIHGITAQRVMAVFLRSKKAVVARGKSVT